MKPLRHRFGRRSIGAALLLGALAGCSTVPDEKSPRPDGVAAEKGPLDWSNVSVNLLISRYGPPDDVQTDRVVWNDKGPWKKITVSDELGFVTRDSDGKSNIEETIVYHVPAEKRDALADFSKALTVSPDGEELSARSGSEESNYLALNLADQIARNAITPAQARVTYLKTLSLADAGKDQPLMRGLQFPHARSAVIKNAFEGMNAAHADPLAP